MRSATRLLAPAVLLASGLAAAQLDTISADYADGTLVYSSFLQTSPTAFQVSAMPWPADTATLHGVEVVYGADSATGTLPVPPSGWLVGVWSSLSAFSVDPLFPDVHSSVVAAPDTGASDAPVGSNLGGGSNFLIGFDLPDLELSAGGTYWFAVIALGQGGGVVESAASGPSGWTVFDILGLGDHATDSDPGTQFGGALAMRLNATVHNVPWIDHGGGTVGFAGKTPVLSGSGDLKGGDPFLTSLADARPDTVATLVLGAAELSAPFKGGVLVPVPHLLVPFIPTGPTGDQASFGATWPLGVPSGASVWFQMWVSDVDGPFGYAASNGLQASAP